MRSSRWAETSASSFSLFTATFCPSGERPEKTAPNPLQALSGRSVIYPAAPDVAVLLAGDVIEQPVPLLKANVVHRSLCSWCTVYGTISMNS